MEGEQGISFLANKKNLIIMAHNEVNHAVGKKGQPAQQPRSQRPRSQRLSFLPPPPRGGPPWSERGGDKMRDPGNEVPSVVYLTKMIEIDTWGHEE